MTGPLPTASPRQESPPRSRTARSSRPPATGSSTRPRVLIAEDDHDLRELYAWCLEGAGWRVEAVADGQDALFVAPTFEPDVIVMDLRLPVLGGVEAIRWLKANPKTKEIPIVACTALEREEAEDLAVKAGCELFIAKPCTPEALQGFLEELVRGRR